MPGQSAAESGQSAAEPGQGAAEPEVPKRSRLPTQTSQASSIVVKYVSPEGEVSSEPPSLSSSLASASTLSQARKLIPGEISSGPSSSEDEGEGEWEGGEGAEHPAQLTYSSSLESIGSNMSIYSAEGGMGDYSIVGEVQLGVWHKNNTLFVRVVRATGLAAAKRNKLSDPYVKTYLLPDKTKHTKRKTGVQRRTTHPEFNEILKVLSILLLLHYN